MRSMTISWRRLALTLLAAGAAGCANGTDPNARGAFDAARVEAGIRAVDRVASAPVLQAFKGLDRHVGGVASVPGGAAAAAGAARFIGAVRAVAGLVVPTGAALVPVIRTSVLGSTYVYDPAGDRYVADPARGGAPANGVRFILYETDPATGKPSRAREVGHADLRDTRASAENALGLSLEVVAGGVTHLQYAFDLSGSIGSATFLVRGTMTDGTDRVDFDITATGQLFGRGGPATVEGRIAVPGHDFEVTTRLVGTAGESGGDGRLDLTVRSGADRIEVRAVTAAGRLDARFTVNGTLLATATGDPEAPVIRGEGGRELTEEEMRALAAIVGFAEGVFTLLGELLAPAGGLLLIALGLAA